MDKKSTAEFAFDLQVGLNGADVPEYDAAVEIGKAAVLAINLRGLGEIDYGALRLVASHHFKIRSDSLDHILHILAELELIRLVTAGSSIKKIIPDIPHFEDTYERVGEYIDQKPLNEIEAATIEILRRLYEAPQNKDSLRNNIGIDNSAFNTSLQIGGHAGLITDQRARGRNILASPLYFSGNLQNFIDMAARGETPNIHRVLQLVRQHQGMPLSTIMIDRRISEVSISSDQAELVRALAAEGIIKPPTITRPNGASEQFVFTPEPGKVRMSAAKREIYEKGMALAAAVRKGQLLPEAYRIKYPHALLSKLANEKSIRASTEAAHQYRNLTVLGLGRLEHTGGGFFKFRLIDVPENVEAVWIADQLISGETPADLEQDTQARLLLARDEAYVRSHISSAQLRAPQASTIISDRAMHEIDQFMLQL
ncbi:hypothetical protein [Caulobacter sp. NIBR1757]|uniref:hypothetical protein n=1 Tax=Caulobacter sp. NIBR1757 TaxID=3016000 RepID=UPI0022F03040|nr:hypothetical protein [Caulobacter sp. NIBR1757]WGM39935.1 hypothetical protein AMEJIAPC_02875 [Caulobacter sp. NIBR1757]